MIRKRCYGFYDWNTKNRKNVVAALYNKLSIIERSIIEYNIDTNILILGLKK